MFYVLCLNDFVERFDMCRGITNINTSVEVLSHKICEKLSEVADGYDVSDYISISMWKELNTNGYFYISYMNKFDSEYSNTGEHYYVVNMKHTGHISRTFNYFKGIINNIKRDETIDRIIK